MERVVKFSEKGMVACIDSGTIEIQFTTWGIPHSFKSLEEFHDKMDTIRRLVEAAVNENRITQAEVAE